MGTRNGGLKDKSCVEKEKDEVERTSKGRNEISKAKETCNGMSERQKLCGKIRKPSDSPSASPAGQESQVKTRCRIADPAASVDVLW